MVFLGTKNKSDVSLHLIHEKQDKYMVEEKKRKKSYLNIHCVTKKSLNFEPLPEWSLKLTDIYVFIS